MQLVGLIIIRALIVYEWLLIARMVLSWVPLLAPRFEVKGIVAVFFEFIYTITDPPIRLAQRFIPPLRLGGVGLDLAFMVVFLAVLVIQKLIVFILF